MAEHPEDHCHRCLGPNFSWFTPGAVWDPVMRPIPGEPWKWNEIICPTCFVELAGGGTFHLIPAKGDGERWTGADERAAIIANAKVALLDDLEAARAEIDRAATITNTKAALDYLAGLREDIATLTAQRDRAERRHERLESGVEALAADRERTGFVMFGGERTDALIFVSDLRALLAESAASEEGA